LRRAPDRLTKHLTGDGLAFYEFEDGVPRHKWSRSQSSEGPDGPASLTGAARPHGLDLEGEGRAENFSADPASFHF
jgi:hypothetical protein